MQFMQQKKNNDSDDFCYRNEGDIMIYFHQDCYFKNNYLDLRILFFELF